MKIDYLQSRQVAKSPDEKSKQEDWFPEYTRDEAKELIPCLNGLALKDIRPETIDPQSHTLTFYLFRTDKNKDVWSDLLSRPSLNSRVVSFTVGLVEEGPIPTKVQELKLKFFPVGWVLVAILLFLILLYMFFRLAKHSTLLRDPGTTVGDPPGIRDLFWPPFRHLAPNTGLGPYSLARTQMAFWFFLVIASFVLIWMVIGETDTITSGVLVLLGVSAGTALGATVVDSSKRPRTPDCQSPLVGSAEKLKLLSI